LEKFIPEELWMEFNPILVNLILVKINLYEIMKVGFG
jgi:hypothetical protein